MKKLITIIITLTFVCTCAAVAENNDASFFYGTWITVYTQPAGSYTLTALHLLDDGTAYFTRQIFKEGQPAESSQEVRTWTVTDGGIAVIDQDGKKTQYSVLSNDFIGNKKGFVIYGYTRFNEKNPMNSGSDYQAMTDAQLAEMNLAIQNELFARHIANDGVTVPPGQYVVGVDLPAGRYRFVSPEQSEFVSIEVYRVDEDAVVIASYYSIGSLRDAAEAVVTLYDGDSLIVDDSNVIIKPYTGLF